MNRKWMIKATGLAAGIAIFAAACGQTLDSSTPGPESTNGSPSGIQEPAFVGDGSDKLFVPPNPAIDQGGTVIVDNPNIDDREPTSLPIVPDVQPSEYAEVLMLAQEDLNRRFDLDIEDITLVKIVSVEWPDTALGNPEPGMAYAQVIVPGFKMMLEAGEQTYIYHTSLDRVVFVEDSATVVVEPGNVGIPLPVMEPSDSSDELKPAPPTILPMSRPPVQEVPTPGTS